MANLCSYCCKIPFSEFAAGLRDALRIGPRKSEIENKFSLGPLSRILESNCPFCLLVCKATVLQRNLSAYRALSHDKEVEVRWISGARITRGGFAITRLNDVWLAFGVNFSSSPRYAYLLPKLPVELDVSRVSGWIDHCTSHHTCVIFPRTTTSSEAFPGLRVLRFIDTVEGCIVERTELVQYAALSYVWGSCPTFQLTKANLDKLTVPGALLNPRFSDLLPKTLLDALLLTKRLNIRFSLDRRAVLAAKQP
jgi:hypothetical protein